MLKYLYTGTYGDEDEYLGTIQQSDQSARFEYGTLPDRNQSSVNPSSKPRSGGSAKVHPEDGGHPDFNASAIENNVLVYALADKYDIQLLKALAMGEWF